MINCLTVIAKKLGLLLVLILSLTKCALAANEDAYGCHAEAENGSRLSVGVKEPQGGAGPGGFKLWMDVSTDPGTVHPVATYTLSYGPWPADGDPSKVVYKKYASGTYTDFGKEAPLEDKGAAAYEFKYTVAAHYNPTGIYGDDQVIQCSNVYQFLYRLQRSGN